MVIKHQNDQILKHLNQKTAEKINFLPPDLPVQLPLKSDEDLQLIENYLKESDRLSDLVIFL